MSVLADQLYRIWMPTEQTVNSSFSLGFMSQFDSQLQLYPETGGNSVSFFNAAAQKSYLFVDGIDGDTQDGVFHDLRNASTRKMELKNSSGTVVTDPANADKLVVTHWSGLTEQFELIDLDPSTTEEDWAGRLTKRTDRLGRELVVTYKTWTSTEISASPSRQWQIDTVEDAFGNELTFTYDSTQHAGRWCVTAIERGDSASVAFDYASNALETVTFEDGSETTYAYSQNTTYDTTVVATSQSFAMLASLPTAPHNLVHMVPRTNF